MAARDGILEPGFDVVGARDRLAEVIRARGGTVEPQYAHAAATYVWHALWDHLADAHRGGMPRLDTCEWCGLLQAHWRLTDFQQSAAHSKPWLALAAAARRAAKQLRAATKELEGAWRDFEPIASRLHAEWERWPQLAKLRPHDHALVCEAAPETLALLREREQLLQRLAGLNAELVERQFAQPLGKKPSAQLLSEIEGLLYAAGLSDAEVVGIICEGAEAGRIERLRARRAALAKKLEEDR